MKESIRSIIIRVCKVAVMIVFKVELNNINLTEKIRSFDEMT